MKKNSFIKKWSLNLILVLGIVGVSIYYSTGKGVNVFNNVLKNKNEIPIHSVETEEKVVAITINTGYGKQFTDEILDVLEKENVTATFFVIGSWIDKYSDSIKNINKLGHEIGNNSYSYPHFTKISKEQIEQEVISTENKINEITNNNTKLFRPPFGDYSSNIVKKVSEMGYTSIMWDVDSLDWGNKSEKEISEIILKQVANGSIMLFHNNFEKTPGALKIAIEELKIRGYKFIKVSDLIYKDNFYIDHAGRQKLTK